ncbi:Protein kinase domain-containing protein [Lentzea xinjiangensis]|uniref:non-specific serine/threonine protein kinase n=1 Tax=Lentzea xinjiangensis TaxID=402600 RepID=A0A1H9GW99_9PSEU|nr:serine/threonine-protein kinase [Lentzea xinjiangensis]SEQ54371.1 Protein kinase domain-containing protein [Lentzea xinjiangensis]
MHSQAVEPRVIAGRYALMAELGRGGMGIVWRAQDRHIGRYVAIKELHLPEGIAHEERRVLEERALREARTAGKLNDPAVVTVYDAINENGLTYIIMELVEAATLSTLISAHGPMPQNQVVSIALQALSALETAHAAGIVHRDVKPGNLMVRPDGKVKLTDFGIAQAVDDPRLTTSGSLIGSPAYMSPERIHGHEAGPASDLWALGATLCYAVEGWSPFERSSTASTLHAIMSETPRLTRATGVLSAVITGLLIADPNARLSGPQARAMLASIGNQPTPPTGIPPVQTQQYRQAAPADPAKKKRTRVLALAGAVAIAAAAFTGGIYAHSWFTAPGGGDSATLTYGEGGEVPVFGLSENVCGNGQVAPTKLLDSDTREECDKPHDFEVFDAVETLPVSSALPDAAYPGAEALTSLGVARCELTLRSRWVKDGDSLKLTTLIPTGSAWQKDKNDTAQRRIYCVANKKDGSRLDGTISAKKDN